MSSLNTLYGILADTLYVNVPELKHIDIDLGQLTKAGAKIPVEYPGLLMRFENVMWKEFDTSKQIGLVHIRLKIIYPFVDETEYYTREHAVRTEVSTFFDLIQSINYVVSVIPIGISTKLYRFNENHLDSLPDEQKWIYCLDYYCNIYSDGSYFSTGATLDLDKNFLTNTNLFLERTIDGKKVG